MVDPALLLSAGVLTFLFGWNNSSYLIGGVTGTGTLSLRGSTILAIVGIVSGVLLEGGKMLSSLNGGIAAGVSTSGLLVAFLVSSVIVLILSVAKLPASFSMTLVGAFAGTAYAAALPFNISKLGVIIGFWFLAPVATGLITAAAYRVVARVSSGYSLFSVDVMNRLGIILSSLAVAYSLGANNVGLFYGGIGGQLQSPQDVATIVLLTLVAIVGTLLLGRGGVSGTMGDRMLVLSPQGLVTAFISSSVVIWVGTQFAIPISIGQCLIGGMLAAASARSVAGVNQRLVIETISTWAVVPLSAFVISYLISV